MSKLDVVPVTKQEMTQTNINYSTKIGKQVMKAELKSRYSKATDELNEAKTAVQSFTDVAHQELKGFLKSRLKFAMRSDSEMTRLRNLLNKFMPIDAVNYKTNMDLISDSGISDALRNLVCLGSMNSHEREYLKGIIEKEKVGLSVAFDFGRPDEDCYDNFCEFAFDLNVSLFADQLELLKTRLSLEEKRTTAQEKQIAIATQLENIDNVVEEMEAKLLINELNSTEQGKAVLNVTSEMVSNMLGDKPALLNLDKD